MKPGDQHDSELKDLLGDVRVPEGLRDRLLQIPDGEMTRSSPPPKPTVIKRTPGRSSRFGMAMVVAVAALLATVLFSLAWMGEPPVQQADRPTAKDNAGDDAGDNAGNPPGGVPLNPGRSDAAEHDAGASAEQLLQEMEMRSREINELLNRQANRRLQRRLVALRQQRKPDAGLAERWALVQGLTSQASLELGVSFESVRGDLRKVVEQYPDTRGAGLARSLLSENEL